MPAKRPVVGDFVSEEPGGLTGEMGDSARAPAVVAAPSLTPAAPAPIRVARLLLLRGMLSGGTDLLSATGATRAVRPLAPFHSGRVCVTGMLLSPVAVLVVLTVGAATKLLAAGATTTGFDGTAGAVCETGAAADAEPLPG